LSGFTKMFSGKDIAPHETSGRWSHWIKYPQLLVYGVRLVIHEARRIVARELRAHDHAGKLAEEARHWSKGEKGHTWLDSAVINDLVAREISGDAGVYWLLHFRRRHAPETLGLALNLGCGAGGLERNAFAIGIARAFDSCDISRRAIEEAGRGEKIAGPVNFICADINNIELGQNRYDAVFAVNILHHLTELEHVLDQVRRSLRPGGLFVIHEYAGPARFQWKEAQLRAVNEALDALPRKYRINRRRGGVKRRVYRPILDETNPDSPFEAARSDEILQLIYERFECVERVDIGGALLHPLLEAIVANFDEKSEEDRAMLEGLWNREKELMRQGVLVSDFVYGVFRRKDEG